MMVKEKKQQAESSVYPATKVYPDAHCRTPVNPCIGRHRTSQSLLEQVFITGRHTAPQVESLLVFSLPSYLLSPELGPCCFQDSSVSPVWANTEHGLAWPPDQKTPCDSRVCQSLTTWNNLFLQVTEKTEAESTASPSSQ